MLGQQLSDLGLSLDVVKRRVETFGTEDKRAAITGFGYAKVHDDPITALKAAVKCIELPKRYENLNGLLADLKAAHNAEQIVFSSVKEVTIRF